MGYFESQTVMDVLNSVCRAVSDTGRPVSAEIKDMLAKRLLASYEAGIVDPEVLKADALAAVPGAMSGKRLLFSDEKQNAA
jgi:hypothetical protein